jgi:ribose/xylose/arabinose/galactoside ABC-type transport system permease subunit
MITETNSSSPKNKNIITGFRRLLAGKDGNTLRQNWVNYAFLGAFVLLMILTATMSDVFFTQRNLSNLLRQAVSNGFLSLGMLIVILTGGIDLSVGPIVALTGIMVAGFSNQGWPLWLAILACLVVGVAVGAVNGLLIARFKLQPFIVTLATLGAIRGLVFVYSDIPITPHDPSFRAILGSGMIGPLPISAMIMLISFPLVWFFLNRTRSGRAIVAIGGNEEAVRLAGINVSWNITLAYMISGFFAAVAGVILASRLGISQPSVGAGFELDAIAACVIGGAILGGGGGSTFGTLAGVIALGMIDNLLNLFNVQSYYQQILKGIIILVAVLARRRQR